MRRGPVAILVGLHGDALDVDASRRRVLVIERVLRLEKTPALEMSSEVLASRYLVRGSDHPALSGGC